MAATAEPVQPYGVLLVEDDRHACELARLLLERDPQFVIVGEAPSAEAALAFVEHGFVDVVVIDHVLEGDVTGSELARMVKRRSPGSRVVLFSGFTDADPGDGSVDAVVHKLHGEKLVPAVRGVLGLGEESAGG